MSLDTQSSSALGLADLDTDLIDLIFSHLPDFEALRSAILISKRFSTVFDKHPKSIVTRVAQNVAGLPLDDLLTLVRFEKPDIHEWENEDAYDYPDEEDFLLNAFLKFHEQMPEWQDASKDGQEVKAKDISIIDEYAHKANLLEEWFSFRRKKNRTAAKSSLTTLESQKFLRAVYRLMLFQKCFGYEEAIQDIQDECYEKLPDLAEKPEALQRMFTARKDFLLRFKSEELHEIQVVAHFIVDMQYKISPTSSPALMHEGYLQVYLHHFIEGVRDGYFSVTFQSPHEINEIYLTGPSEAALKEQGNKLLNPEEDDFWMHILDSVEEHSDTCARCSVAQGRALWNQTNWSVFFLHTHYNRLLIYNYLTPGQLSHHRSDRMDISNALNGTPPEVLLTEFQEAYSETGDDWNKEDWLCETCLVELVKTAMPKWWINKRSEQGDPVPSENCCYGWDCLAMTRDSDHASKLNHFCKPTKDVEA